MTSIPMNQVLVCENSGFKNQAKSQVELLSITALANSPLNTDCIGSHSLFWLCRLKQHALQLKGWGKSTNQ
jgi:hypothetical protein